jgi:hypothetical protein
MSLDKYKLPLCLTEGVVFTLDDAPEVKITVAMPISSNRKFAFGWAKRLPMTQDGKFEANPFDVMEAQRAELIESCILKLEGVSEPETFFKDYPLVIEELWAKVQDVLPTYEKQLETEAKN